MTDARLARPPRLGVTVGPLVGSCCPPPGGTGQRRRIATAALIAAARRTGDPGSWGESASDRGRATSGPNPSANPVRGEVDAGWRASYGKKGLVLAHRANVGTRPAHRNRQRRDRAPGGCRISGPVPGGSADADAWRVQP